MRHLDIKIYGEVQGVLYREGAREAANRLGLFGFARNEPDGSVLVELEGEEKDLNKFLEWAKRGTKYSKVENVETKEGPLQNFQNFSVF